MNEIKTSLALGFFDGVHNGHKDIIETAVREGKREGLSPVVLSFDKSPREILGKTDVSYITDNKRKAFLVKNLGASLSFLEAKKEVLDLSPEEFVLQYIVKKYNAKIVCCGYNYHFGKGGKGDRDILRNLSKKYGFRVYVRESVNMYGESISSTRIRSLISDGNIKEANALLGQSFLIEGKVTEGKGLGHTLGFPTANIFFPEKSVIPKKGVYETKTIIKGKTYPSITNVGINPSVGKEALRAETNIIGFTGNIYNEEIALSFVDYMRPEKKFETVDELQAQVLSDIEKVKKRNSGAL